MCALCSQWRPGGPHFVIVTSLPLDAVTISSPGILGFCLMGRSLHLVTVTLRESVGLSPAQIPVTCLTPTTPCTAEQRCLRPGCHQHLPTRFSLENCTIVVKLSHSPAGQGHSSIPDVEGKPSGDFSLVCPSTERGVGTENRVETNLAAFLKDDAGAWH